MRLMVLVLSGLAALACGAAAAGPLSCDTFRTRLDGALIVADGSGPEAPAYRETGTSADGSKRLAWQTSSLDGTMTCGPGGEFREFYVSLTIDSKERFVEQLKRFTALNGAAICAVSDGTPAACVNAGKQLLQIALEEMGAKFQRKLPSPSGEASNKVAPHVQAECTAAPSLITFTVDVDGADSLDEARQPLTQLDRQPGP